MILTSLNEVFVSSKKVSILKWWRPWVSRAGVNNEAVLTCSEINHFHCPWYTYNYHLFEQRSKTLNRYDYMKRNRIKMSLHSGLSVCIVCVQHSMFPWSSALSESSSATEWCWPLLGWVGPGNEYQQSSSSKLQTNQRGCDTVSTEHGPSLAGHASLRTLIGCHVLIL